jgi:DNA polymerase-3 subunit gamma/tau
MAGQALYRKWRSQTFEELVGQEHVALTLRNALRDGRLSHAYLFTGPRGTGKTSTARILAKAINCLAEDPAARPCNHCRICVGITEGRQLDLIEIDAASNRGIDEIRELREKIGFRPNEARYKVYIIDEVHMLTKEAFNALLKTLEEPPPHAIFVLATTEPDRVPETVRSRCQRFDFRRVPTAKIAGHLKEILEAEGARAAPEALQAIARRSTGSMRDAISLADQLLAYGDEMIGLARVESVLGMVDASTVGQLIDHMAAHDAAAGLRLINQLVADGVELGELVDQILGYLRAILFAQVVHATDGLDLPEEAAAAVMRQAEALTPAATLSALREYSDARGLLRDQVPGAPQLPIEMAFLRTALAPSPTLGAQVSGTTVSNAAAAPALAHQGPSAGPPSSGATATTAARPEATPSPRAGPSEPAPASSAGARARQPEGPAPSTQNASAEPAPAAPSDTELLAAVRDNWERILELTKQRASPLLKAALQTVRQLEASSGTLVLQFEHETARGQIDRAENKQKVESLMEEVINRPVHVRCTLVEGKTTPANRTAARSGTEKGGGDDEAFLREARNLGAVIKRLDQ